jgi:hypothetical protein
LVRQRRRILDFWRQGKSKAEIGRHLGLHRKSVERALKNATENGAAPQPGPTTTPTHGDPAQRQHQS